jgi:hypothetical protein
MEYATAQGRCTKCGMDRLQVEGVTKCVVCDVESVSSGLIVDIEDPGEEEINRVLASAGVKQLEGSKPPTPIKPEAIRTVIASKVGTQKSTVPQVTCGATVIEALNILRGLPMPKDLKQFKQINKAIKILESLGE